MNCQTAGELMSGWIDGELQPEEAVVLEAHLSDCQECRSMTDGLRLQDAELRRAFHPQRQRASQVASQVLEILDRESRTAAPTTPRRRFGWGAVSLAVAAGFMLAVALFQPWKQWSLGVDSLETVQSLQPEPPIAQLVVATGAVEMRMPDSTEWQSCSDIKTFYCPSRSEVRTGANVRCELQTADGCIIRLNHDTEIALTSPTSVAIRRGQIWCSSPDDVSLQIAAPQAETPTELAASSWSFACPSSSCVLTAEQSGSDMQVMTSTGETELQTPHDRERLKAGGKATIVNGRIVRSQATIDPLLEALWVHSLLICKGKQDGELALRINEMLSQVGRSEVTGLYEQAIRGLGENAVPPLLRFVQSSLAQEESDRRRTAMRMLSDLAPSWTVPELIELLADEDAEVRVLTATALHRLTGQTHGRSAERWREDREKCAETLGMWQQWWTTNRQQYLPLPTTNSPLIKSDA